MLEMLHRAAHTSLKCTLLRAHSLHFVPECHFESKQAEIGGKKVIWTLYGCLEPTFFIFNTIKQIENNSLE